MAAQLLVTGLHVLSHQQTACKRNIEYHSTHGPLPRPADAACIQPIELPNRRRNQHSCRGVSMDTIVNGLARAMQESPVYATLVLCIQRESKAISPPDVLRQALPHLHTTINAVGLDGSELQHPPWMFEDVFEAATKLRLRKTAHAGRFSGWAGGV